jgi:hypothetical protein
VSFIDPISRPEGAEPLRQPHPTWDAAMAWATCLLLPVDHVAFLKAMLKCTYGSRLLCCAHIDTILAKVEGDLGADKAFRIIRNLLAWGVIVEVKRPKGRRCRAFEFVVGAVIAKPRRPKMGRPWKAKQPEEGQRPGADDAACAVAPDAPSDRPDVASEAPSTPSGVAPDAQPAEAVRTEDPESLQMASCKSANGHLQTYRGNPQETEKNTSNCYSERYPEQEASSLRSDDLSHRPSADDRVCAKPTASKPSPSKRPASRARRPARTGRPCPYAEGVTVPDAIAPEDWEAVADFVITRQGELSPRMARIWIGDVMRAAERGESAGAVIHDAISDCQFRPDLSRLDWRKARRMTASRRAGA